MYIKIDSFFLSKLDNFINFNIFLLLIILIIKYIFFFFNKDV